MPMRQENQSKSGRLDPLPTVLYNWPSHTPRWIGESTLLTDIELIRKIEFFEALEPKVLKQIAEMCIVREFSAGEYIVRQGESGLGLYFITAGKAKVEIDRNDVKVVVAELKEGDSLGEFSIIDEKARSA